MAKYKVIASELVYSTIIIEAENENEAIEKAFLADYRFWENGDSDFQIDKAILLNEGES
ncbi:MAG: hypothetical protein RLY40_1000 [Pseudomonadota bacterium]|jgi:16S rRNA C967 or C1407 C5-methylase (RsmB/RsmF family)